MKLSARNQLKGRIVSVTMGQTTAPVGMDVDGTVVSASFTNEAVDELKRAVGRQAYAVGRACDVMIAVD